MTTGGRKPPHLSNKKDGEKMKLTKKDIAEIKRIWFINKQINKLQKRSMDIRLKFQDDKNIAWADFSLIYRQLQNNGVLK